MYKLSVAINLVVYPMHRDQMCTIINIMDHVPVSITLS